MYQFASLRAFFDSLLHPSLRGNAVLAARHRAFIAPRLLVGLLGFLALPVLLAARAAPQPFDIAVVVLMCAPVVVAYAVSATGRYDICALVSATAMALIVSLVAMATGGLHSFIAPWFVVIPLEASLSASARTVRTAFAVLTAGLLATVASQLSGLLPQLPPPDAGSTALGLGSAILYAGALAIAARGIVVENARRLYAEEARYRLLARNMTDVIACYGQGGAVTFVSPAAEQMFGAPAGALRGHGLFDRVHVADRPAFLTAISDAAALSLDRSVEFRVRREEEGEAVARYIWVEMRCRPLDHRVDGDGEIGLQDVVAVLRDISERKIHEERLQAARSDAERANADKSRFLAVVSHELRTPLNAVIGFSQMLAEEEAMQLDRARRIEYATLIKDSGEHLLSVVNGILDMSRIEAGHFHIVPEPFDPVPAVRGCCDLLALKARQQGIEIALDAPAGCEVVADRRALRQIMLNLIANAVKFSPAGSKVNVRVKLAGADFVVIVEDTGIGIAGEDLPRLGSPFFQVASSYDRPYNGTGLGLSIVKGLIDLHGGHFHVESRLKEGTRVTVRLPRHYQGAISRTLPLERVATGVAALIRPPAGRGRTATAALPEPVSGDSVPTYKSERKAK